MDKKEIKLLIDNQCYLKDRARLLRLWRKAESNGSGKSLIELEKACHQSILQVEARAARVPEPAYNRDLPFYQSLEEIRNTIANHQVTVLCGETGSGKTTQLPQLCLQMGLAGRGKIGHTQPRRLAALSVAQRISDELKDESGLVGTKIRFTDTTTDQGLIKMMTDGMLLAETAQDNWLNEYQTIIIDEAHERSLNIDLLLGFLKGLLSRRPELKLIITSATIDPGRFSEYFNSAPIITVSGRTYPVDIRYQPPTDDQDRQQAVIESLQELYRNEGREDCLIFLPGERQIRELQQLMVKAFPHSEVLPLYARLNSAQQQKIFKRSNRPKIVLTTNVAETSLTVPGIRYVIDTGLARLSRYSWRSKVQRLPIEKISQASANQRAGRCGRVGAGICVRLYSEDDFQQRDEFTAAEILRTNLALVILQMENLRVGHIRDFDFIESPDYRLINDGYRLLFEIGATDKDEKILPLGKRMSRLPLDPRLSAMVFKADQLDCLNEMLIIVSALSIQDPRDQGVQNRDSAQEKFRQWQNKKSDLLSWLGLWDLIAEQRQQLSRSGFRRWCKKQYLSSRRLQEWNDIYQQLLQQCQQLQLKVSKNKSDDDTLNRALLAGLPSHVARWENEGGYQSTRGRQPTIFPGSVLARNTPSWIAAFAFIETSRLFAHGVTTINSQWLLSDFRHLLQREYVEPHWQEAQARVAAYRNTRLYGLLVESRVKVNYASVDAKTSRDIFIREGLVQGSMKSSIGFFIENQKLIERYREQESKERRRDLLVGEETLFDFYQKRVPDKVVDGITFEKWALTLNPAEIKKLTLFSEDVLQSNEVADEKNYPKILQVREQKLPLSYIFDPADDADGITVRIPLAIINQFTPQDFEKLVPGFLAGKIEALLKTLPKSVRKNFVPIKEFAGALISNIESGPPLISQLQDELQRMTGVIVKPDDWKMENLEPHFLMRYEIMDETENVAASRDLVELQNRFSAKAKNIFQQKVSACDEIIQGHLLEWSFGEWQHEVSIEQSGQKIKVFPALVDYQEYVEIELFDTRTEADFYHYTGMARLLLIGCKSLPQVKKGQWPNWTTISLQYMHIAHQDELLDDLYLSSILEIMEQQKWPTNADSFNSTLSQIRGQFVAVVEARCEIVFRVMKLYKQVKQALEDNPVAQEIKQDCIEQVENLIYPGFLRDLDSSILLRYPAYFQGIIKRLDNNGMTSQRELASISLIQEFWSEYIRLYESSVEPGKLSKLRWQIEEFRINQFAQPMKTPKPVSEKKLRHLIQSFSC